MKSLIVTSVNLLSQLEDMIEKITPADYSKPSDRLNGSSIGQHVRHTLEFFICLEQGYRSGRINYDQRSRDHRIEKDKQFATDTIDQIKTFLRQHTGDQALCLEFSYEEEKTDVMTTYYREVAYNAEHTIHHMAIMKIAIAEVAEYINLPLYFGVAPSTERYMKSKSAVVEQ